MDKREARRLRNKESAAASREKAKRYLSFLEER